MNRAEAENIAKATQLLVFRPRGLDSLLDDMGIRAIHRQMFGEVWTWAGKYRKVNLNIGVTYEKVSVEVRNLVEDAKYWFPPKDASDDLVKACQFHHRLVSIHPFQTGNGRHSRYYADLLLDASGYQPISWNEQAIAADYSFTEQYIFSLRVADHGDIQPLIELAKSAN